MAYLADYHVHTAASPDAFTSMTDLAYAGEQAGLDEMCFTDHVEPFYWDALKTRTEYDWSSLQKDFRAAQAVSHIQLRLGCEFGDAAWSFPDSDRLLDAAPELDFIIGSIHCLPAAYNWTDLYVYDYERRANHQKMLRDYLAVMLDMVRWGRFNVLGHLTLPLRYGNEGHGLHLSFDAFEDEIRVILRTLIENGKGIELNTNRGHMPLPDAKWLRIYRELGGEIITLGSDAHTPNYVGCAIRERQALLKECGFVRFCTFDQQKPVWHSL